MKGLTILAYHRVHPARRGALCVTAVDLERQIRILLDRGLRPLRGTDLIETLDGWRIARAGGAEEEGAGGTQVREEAASWEVPARFPGAPSFLVTFDDGYADVARHAWPVLRGLGVPAVVFLIHDWVGRREPFPWEVKYNAVPGPDDFPLRWEEVRSLKSEGCEFGSHTLTHPDLPSAEPGRAREEIAASRRRLEDRLGTRVNLFCYPRGGYSPALAQEVSAAGYGAAFLTPRGPQLGEHRFCVRRVGVYAADRLWRYRLKVSGIFETLREARLRWSSRKPDCCS